MGLMSLDAMMSSCWNLTLLKGTLITPFVLSAVGRKTEVKGKGKGKGKVEGVMEILQILSSKSIAIALRKEMNGE